jgi:hypothetical protein
MIEVSETDEVMIELIQKMNRQPGRDRETIGFTVMKVFNIAKTCVAKRREIKLLPKLRFSFHTENTVTRFRSTRQFQQ